MTDPNDSLRDAERLYNEPLNPQKTKEIEGLLKRAATEERAAADKVVAARKAFEGIVALCDYLNRWNGVGKMNLRAAEQDIETALAISPNLAAAYYAKGFVYRTKGEHENALAAFQKSLEIDGDNARAIAQVGAEQLYLGHPAEALSHVRRALELSPKHPARGMFRWIGARALFFDGKYKEAIPWLRQAIELWPDLWYTLAYDVSAHALIGDAEPAKKKLQSFLHRFPELGTVARIQDAEQTNPNKNAFVVEGRRKFHEGLHAAGMPLR